MKKHVVFISGWAHPAQSLQPIGDALGPDFDVSLHAASDRQITLDKRSILVGWSLGGMLAMDLAIKHPELVSRLVLIGSTPRFTFTPGEEFGTPEANLVDLMKQLSEDIKTTLQGFIAYAALPHRPSLKTFPQHLELLHDGLRYLKTRDLRPDIHNIKCPVLLLHGKQDAVISHAASEWLQRNLAQAKLVSVDNMGHDLPLRRPELVVAHVQDFHS